MNFLQVGLVILVGIALLAAGCIEATSGEGTSESPFWVKETTTAPTGTPITTATMNSEYVSQATPYPATTPTTIPTVRQPPDDTPAKPVYPEVLYESIDLNGEAHAWTINATYPPLVVDLVITPEMEERTIAYQSSYGDRDDMTETVTRIKESAYLEVTVRDAGGNIVAQDGFSGKYTMGTSKQLFVMSGGTYQIDLRGNDVNVGISIKIGKIDSETTVSV